MMRMVSGFYIAARCFHLQLISRTVGGVQKPHNGSGGEHGNIF